MSSKSVLATDSDCPFPETYYKSIGSTVRGFAVFFPNLSDSLRNLIQPSSNLINTESGTEETSTVPTQYLFYPGQQQIEKNIKSYNNVPQKHFINESYILYDKSDLIKETYIIALNEKISIYGSISYFNEKTENEIFKIISPENFLKFFVNRDTNKDSLNFQLTSISGNLPTLIDKK